MLCLDLTVTMPRKKSTAAPAQSASASLVITAHRNKQAALRVIQDLTRIQAATHNPVKHALMAVRYLATLLENILEIANANRARTKVHQPVPSSVFHATVIALSRIVHPLYLILRMV